MYTVIKLEPLIIEHNEITPATDPLETNNTSGKKDFPISNAEDNETKEVSDNDVYNHFGNYIATSLLLLLRENRHNAELAISQILLKEKMNFSKKIAMVSSK